MNSQSTSSKALTSFTADDFAKALEQHDYNFQAGQVVNGKIIAHDNTGVYVDIGGKSAAFVPLAEASLSSEKPLAEVLPLNEEMDFLIVREQNEDGQVTLSRRQLEIKQRWNKVLQLQEENQSVQVRVTGTNKGGVTVNLKGLRGFIPRSHLLERENLEALVGESLTVSFIEVNSETRKLVLSQRLATQSASFSQFEVGQLVEGKISGIKPFGLFVDLGGATGLIHIKQISQNFVESIPSVFQLGQSVKAIIINLDEGRNRISLSTRILENYPGEMIEKGEEVMASAEARRDRAAKQLLS
ncbi:MAG: S1 RNA-binding domain-containing protein [Desertifilum sp. SIO1I2]|nr:S1 RNA-binding domain-containing protein [Desertifilum sp. SIO1I2]